MAVLVSPPKSTSLPVFLISVNGTSSPLWFTPEALGVKLDSSLFHPIVKSSANPPNTDAKSAHCSSSAPIQARIVSPSSRIAPYLVSLVLVYSPQIVLDTQKSSWFPGAPRSLLSHRDFWWPFCVPSPCPPAFTSTLPLTWEPQNLGPYHPPGPCCNADCSQATQIPLPHPIN